MDDCNEIPVCGCGVPASITLTIADDTPDGPITYYKTTTYRGGCVVDETPPGMAEIVGD